MENRQIVSEVTPVVKPLSKSGFKKNISTLLVSLLIVAVGVLTGWLFSGGKPSMKTESNLSESVVANDKEAGAKDETQFSTTTEGTLREGGIKGEGTHYLERQGGVSQNAYLTSTTLDMTPFVGKKVKVWGETISGVHAGWLIDVGKIKVID